MIEVNPILVIFGRRAKTVLLIDLELLVDLLLFFQEFHDAVKVVFFLLLYFLTSTEFG